MEPTRFDRLTKEVVQPSSRRRVIGGVLGGVLASLLGTRVDA
jgi:hypothetical protein